MKKSSQMFKVRDPDQNYKMKLSNQNMENLEV